MARETVRRFVELNKDDVAWFDETYPKGSLSGILSLLLTEYRNATSLTPQDYAKLAVEEIRGK